MIKVGMRLLVIVGLVIALSGCNMNNNDQGTGADTNRTNTNKVNTNNNTGIKQQANTNNRNGNNNGNNSMMAMNNKIAEAIADMDGVDTATVLMSDQNAYVAVVLDNGRDKGSMDMRNANRDRAGTRMTPNALGSNPNNSRTYRRDLGAGDDEVADDLKSAIADKVRSIEPDVDKVYVSANADFVGRMRGYGERFQNGQPISGLISEFNTLIDRIFPTAE